MPDGVHADLHELFFRERNFPKNIYYETIPTGYGLNVNRALVYHDPFETILQWLLDASAADRIGDIVGRCTFVQK